MSHEFLLQPGVWIGEGKISFSKSPNTIKFYTKWQVNKSAGQPLHAVQIVEMAGIPDQVINIFEITKIGPESFSITIENEHIGSMVGKGVIEPQLLAWEFRGQGELEGFEVYERQENGDYSFRAEYTSPDNYRTLVEGLIWQKLH